MLALMSAQNPTAVSADGKYSFKQDKAIPAYLMALSVGYLEFKAIDERSGVYAEAGLLEKSWNEFQELPAMIAAAEALYGPMPGAGMICWCCRQVSRLEEWKTRF